MRKRRGFEGVEEVRGHLPPELLDLLSDELSVEGRPVDELQRPGSHVQPGLLTVQLLAAVKETAKTHMGERAAHVGENLDRGHTDSSVDGQPGIIVAREHPDRYSPHGKRQQKTPTQGRDRPLDAGAGGVHQSESIRTAAQVVGSWAQRPPRRPRRGRRSARSAGRSAFATLDDEVARQLGAALAARPEESWDEIPTRPCSEASALRGLRASPRLFLTSGRDLVPGSPPGGAAYRASRSSSSGRGSHGCTHRHPGRRHRRHADRQPAAQGSCRTSTITVVDENDRHVYQPGLLFVPFGLAHPDDIVRPRGKQLHAGIDYHQSAIDHVDIEAEQVHLADGTTLDYDVLVVATGSRLVPEETEGLTGSGWMEKVFTFYDLDGRHRAGASARPTFEGGRVVVNVVDMPIKCPVAPLEFCFLADWYFHERGIRDRRRAHLRHPARRRVHQADGVDARSAGCSTSAASSWSPSSTPARSTATAAG